MFFSRDTLTNLAFSSTVATLDYFLAVRCSRLLLFSVVILRNIDKAFTQDDERTQTTFCLKSTDNADEAYKISGYIDFFNDAGFPQKFINKCSVASTDCDGYVWDTASTHVYPGIKDKNGGRIQFVCDYSEDSAKDGKLLSVTPSKLNNLFLGDDADKNRTECFDDHIMKKETDLINACDGHNDLVLLSSLLVVVGFAIVFTAVQCYRHGGCKIKKEPLGGGRSFCGLRRGYTSIEDQSSEYESGGIYQL